MKAPVPIFRIVYEGRNITTDITRNLLSVTYTDKNSKESDEVDIQLEDTDGKWRDPWFPTKGDKFVLDIGYKGEDLYPCGTFVVDEIELSGPPDTINIRALAASVKASIRTKKSRAHEGQTLREIAEKVAAENGLTLIDGTSKTTTGKIEVDQERAVMVAEATKILQEAKSTFGVVFDKSTDNLLPIVQPLRRKGYVAVANYIFENATVLKKQVAQLKAKLASAGSVQFSDQYKAAARSALAFGVGLLEREKQLKNKDFKVTSSQLDKVRINRVTQNQETDLQFLTRVGDEYGFLFSVRDTKLTFIYQEDLDKKESVTMIDRTDLISYNIKDQSKTTYSKAKVSYHDPATRTVVEHITAAEELKIGAEAAVKANVKADTLVVHTKAENKQQAEQKARAALYKANSIQQEGSIEVIGNPLLVSGNNFQLTGMGFLSGDYHITESSHKIDKSGGYTTDLSIKRVAAKPSTSFKNKARKTSGAFNNNTAAIQLAANARSGTSNADVR